jgi:hypothetical protein
MAGVVHGLTMRRESWVRHNVSIHGAVEAVVSKLEKSPVGADDLRTTIDVAPQYCIAIRFSGSECVKFFVGALKSAGRCKRVGISSMCIRNHHSQDWARRNCAGSARIDRNLDQFVRRMVIVWDEHKRGKWG